MFEETLNQEVIDTNTDDGLFDDVVEESTPTETTPKEEPQTEEVTKIESVEPFLNIRYNKEDVALTRDEAIELAQKGKNYDKVFEQYNSLNATLEALAKDNGMSKEEYLNNLSEMQNRFRINNEVQELRKQYPNADADLLNELAQNRINARKTQEVETARQTENASNDEVRRQLDMFRKVYPNLEVDKLDPQVYENVKDGYTLLEAYSIWKNSTVNDSTEKIKQRNEENKRRSMGNVSTSGDVSADDFLKGFLG